jgi:hypothetical protein
MTNEDTLKNKIQTYGWTELETLWENIQEGKTSPDWSSGKALEYFILRCFEKEGAEVRYPYAVSIDSLELGGNENALEQIDGIVYSNEIACLVECKDFTNKVNFEPIAKLRSQLMRRPSTTIASIFSVAGFTQPALILLGFIHPQTILAWESDDIEFSLKNKNFRDSLKQKYRKAIEEADYNFRLEED